MIHLQRVSSEADLSAFCRLRDAPPLDPNAPAMRQADSHWLALDGTGEPVARCSLWWTHAPPHSTHRIGCIGHYAAQDREAAARLLDRAVRDLAAAHCTLAVGPLDGNTFRAYRFITRRSFDGPPHPPFFLEPDNPDTWPADFTAAGFRPFEEYYSAITSLDAPDERLAQAAPWLDAQGITVRSLDRGVFAAELARLYDLIMAAFSRAVLFAPIGRNEFIAQYTPLERLLVPELVLLAEREGQLAGFLLALPDLAQAQRGAPVDTVILKTLAVAPQVGGAGVGSALVALTQERARQMGYRHAIHALMHADNRSRRISAHYARPMRQYTLFARGIGQV